MPPAVHPGQLEVTAIDVGQGDSLLVVGPTGRAMLIDAGGPTGAAANAENAGLTSSTFDIGEEVVSPYLWSRQFRRLDVVALTHAHSDHMGGMPAVLRNFRPRELWVAVDPNSAPYRALLAEAATLGIRVRHLRAGDRIAWDHRHRRPRAHARLHQPRPTHQQRLTRPAPNSAAPPPCSKATPKPPASTMVAASLINPAAELGPDTLLKVGHHGAAPPPRQSSSPSSPRRTPSSPSAARTPSAIPARKSSPASRAHARVFRTDRFGLTTFLLSRDGQISALPAASNP